MSSPLPKSWFVYILRCSDGTLYTGIARDVERRFLEHATGVGAKYTRAHGAKEILYRKKFVDRSSASIYEAQIKKMSRMQKIKLIDYQASK